MKKAVVSALFFIASLASANADLAGSYVDLKTAKVAAEIQWNAEQPVVQLVGTDVAFRLAPTEGTKSLSFDSGILHYTLCEVKGCYMLVRVSGTVYSSSIAGVEFPHLKVKETRIYPGTLGTLTVTTQMVSAKGAKLLGALYRRNLK